MQTNFFQSIIALNAAGDWKLTIKREKDDRLVVSALLYSDAVGDEAKKIVPPFLFKGTAAEIDAGFFGALTAPVQETSALFTNMEQHLKARERAKVESQMEKDKQAKADKEKNEKLKKYDEGMKKAGELEAEGKFRDAWMKVPDANDYPEKAEEIRKRKTELSEQFAPDLFNKNQQPC